MIFQIIDSFPAQVLQRGGVFVDFEAQAQPTRSACHGLFKIVAQLWVAEEHISQYTPMWRWVERAEQQFLARLLVQFESPTPGGDQRPGPWPVIAQRRGKF